MTRRFRRVIFYLLILAFIVGGTGIVLYSVGWRFDLSTFTFQKVGAIYIRSFPKDASISLNDTATKNESWLLENGTLIGNLTPGDYRVRLTAPGYRDWEETLAVRPSLVTEAHYALLVPAEMTPVLNGENAVNFWVFGSGLITKTKEGNLAYGERALRGSDVLEIAEDKNRVLTKDESGAYFLENGLASTSINVGTLLRNVGLGTGTTYSLHLDSNNASNIFILEANSIRSLNVDTGALTNPITAKNREVFATSPARIAWSTFDIKTGVSTVFVSGRTGTAIALTTTTVPAALLRLQFQNEDVLIASGAGNTLYRFDIRQGTTLKIANIVRDFALTDDYSKLATIEDGSVAVTSYANSLASARFALPDMQNLVRISWYRDNEHLFLHYQNPTRLVLLDLHDRNLENLQTLAENAAKTEYDPLSNKLYILKDGKVESVEFPK